MFSKVKKVGSPLLLLTIFLFGMTYALKLSAADRDGGGSSGGGDDVALEAMAAFRHDLKLLEASDALKLLREQMVLLSDKKETIRISSSPHIPLANPYLIQFKRIWINRNFWRNADVLTNHMNIAKAVNEVLEISFASALEKKLFSILRDAVDKGLLGYSGQDAPRRLVRLTDPSYDKEGKILFYLTSRNEEKKKGLNGEQGIALGAERARTICTLFGYRAPEPFILEDNFYMKLADYAGALKYAMVKLDGNGNYDGVEVKHFKNEEALILHSLTCEEF